MLVKTALYYILPGTPAWQWLAGQMVRWILLRQAADIRTAGKWPRPRIAVFL